MSSDLFTAQDQPFSRDAKQVVIVCPTPGLVVLTVAQVVRSRKGLASDSSANAELRGERLGACQ